jgi:hypothetical protein
MTFNVKNIVERVVWTFVQAGIGSLPVTIALTTSSLSAVGWAALSAGVAAVVSLGKNLTAEGIVVQSVKRAGF